MDKGEHKGKPIVDTVCRPLTDVNYVKEHVFDHLILFGTFRFLSTFFVKQVSQAFFYPLDFFVHFQCFFASGVDLFYLFDKCYHKYWPKNSHCS